MLRVLFSRPVVSTLARGPALSASSRFLSSSSNYGSGSPLNSQTPKDPPGEDLSTGKAKEEGKGGSFTHFGFSQVHEHEKESMGQSAKLISL